MGLAAESAATNSLDETHWEQEADRCSLFLSYVRRIESGLVNPVLTVLTPGPRLENLAWRGANPSPHRAGVNQV